MKVKRTPILVPLLTLLCISGGVAAYAATSAQKPDQAVLSPPNPAGTLLKPPSGRSTVIGGEIRSVDSVRDRFSLKVFGGKTMKILFDERTQFYRDQTRVSVLELHANDHASIETTLDGTKVFALRIHIFSETPMGEVQGQVSSYDSQTGQLAIAGSTAKNDVTLHVPTGMKALLVGQQISSALPDGSVNLLRGSMVNVKFRAVGGGRGEVTKIDVLSVPGAAFTYTGNLSSLDVQAGRLVIVDSGDGQSHLVRYDPALFPISHDLQVGSDVKVTTTFDGSEYRAREISVQ